MDISNRKALILNIQRMSTEDGPGIRTTVFFKGCSLSCAWCHNPESIKSYKEIQWIETRCIGCRECIKICPKCALSMTDNGIKIDREKCIRCLLCASRCPGLALEIKGEEWEVDKLVCEVIKDRSYFEKSKGGVTVSGGEALMQADFVSEFLKMLKGHGIHTAVDTCGMCSEKALDIVMPYTDIVLYDIKLIDTKLHRKYTGQPNDIILKNLIYIADIIRKSRSLKKIWIRTPIIPGATATDDNISAIGRFISENISDVVERWDLCTFNNLCRDKYKRLNIDWMFKDAELMEKEEMMHFSDIAKNSGVKPGIVQWTGATRVKE